MIGELHELKINNFSISNVIYVSLLVVCLIPYDFREKTPTNSFRIKTVCSAAPMYKSDKIQENWGKRTERDAGY